MKRRDVLKQGMGALATLAVGEVILLTPDDANAAWWNRKKELYGQRRAGRRPSGKGRLKNDYSRATIVKGVCLNCSTVCGIQGYVIDGKLVKVGGNPEDPNNGKSLCAKGQSGPTINTYPERLLYPLKRVGARGEGKWQRITWDEAHDEIAKRIRKAMDEGKPEEVAIHIGRSRLAEEMGRFLNAIGSPSLLNHRAICSSNKRAANYVSLGETDWESGDFERSKYILDFGANFYEAHQGAIHTAKRIIRGRFNNGAKLVCFDVRLSNTAGRSDEWFAPTPGSDGAIALAMGNAIIAANLHNREWLDTWSNVRADDLTTWIAPYTPEWAEGISGIAAADIRRVALEFASAAPAAVAFTNRGSGAHYNGFNADRAVILLNAIVGSIGQPGGYCYTVEPTRVPPQVFPQPSPQPPSPSAKSAIENPPEWPLANKWQRMKVGQIVYRYLKESRGKVQVYMSYTLASPLTWPEGRSLALEVLKDETLIPFHACSDVVYSETAHYADMILPDASYMERWGFDTRNNMELRDYVTLRQPMVQPPAECKSFVDSLIEIGKRIGPDTAKYFAFKDHEEWTKLRCVGLTRYQGVAADGAQVPITDGFAYMKQHGVWQDLSKPKYYDLYNWALTAAELKNTRVDTATQMIYRTAADGKESVAGLMVNGVARRGFITPSRKFSVYHPDIEAAAKARGFTEDGGKGMPTYFPVPSIAKMKPEQLHLVTFKWNVHTQGRTQSQKYLTEIVHHNPMWINTDTALKLGIKTGDMVEITTYRPYGHAMRGGGEVVGKALVPAWVTEGIHPRVLAVSNTLGNSFHGRAATARNGKKQALAAYDKNVIDDDADLDEDIWWDPARGGTGAGYNINAILPIQPAPLVGMQGWYDTICTVRKV
ncbi:MAG: molybdopterin-dependent oxidoreductase [Pseudorhodobacter sp.]|nr:molybdopterin-dependent oxidoreductase [Rhizobacter sp.]